MHEKKVPRSLEPGMAKLTERAESFLVIGSLSLPGLEEQPSR